MITKLVAIGIALVVGCGKPAALPTVPIAVVSWPSPIRPACELPSLPPLPALATYTTATGSYLERVYIGAREMSDLRQWLADMSLVISAQRRCLEKLSGSP